MKKILSIDGGGIRGLIPALILSEIENCTKKSISESFDLIAGTSTGGILALGLSKSNGKRKPKFTAKALADIYVKHGKEIFSRSLWKGVSSVGGFTDELYSEKGLNKVLNKYFANTQMKSCLTNTLITSYDIQNREPLFLKSWKKEHHSVLMKHAARATSAAPTYFEPALVPINGNKEALIDGGVFINSPSVSAFVEAKRIFPKETDFMLVSLGTGELIRKIEYTESKDWGKAGWLLPLLSCMFDGVSDAADYQMKLLLGKNYHRLQTRLTIANDDMDDATSGNLQNLKTEANKLIRDQQSVINTICGTL